MRRKLWGTFACLLLSLVYAIVIILLLRACTGLRIEWRGGYLPALTYHKTRPDYDALERSRGPPTNSRQASATTNPAPTRSVWPGFRGPERDGQFRAQAILTNWPAQGLKLLWKIPCGAGYGSFATGEGLAFTLEQRRSNETLVAYEVLTGREIWNQGWTGKFQEYFAEEGPRTTPFYDEGKVYSLGALGELRCSRAATGDLLWSKNILSERQAAPPAYGLAASPLVLENKLVVLTSAGKGQSVLCLAKETGQPLWTALDDGTGYASPVVATMAGRTQFIVCGAHETVGLDIGSGKVLWEYPWRVLNDQMPIAQPVFVSTNRFLLSAGYFTGCAMVEIEETPSGSRARTVWKNKNLKNKFTSSVFHEGFIYGLDESILTCLDAATGDRKWKDGHYGYGQLALANGHLLVVSADGDLALVKASPIAHVEEARFHALNGKTWNHPAFAEKQLLVRNGVEMACFEIAP